MCQVWETIFWLKLICFFPQNLNQKKRKGFWFGSSVFSPHFWLRGLEGFETSAIGGPLLNLWIRTIYFPLFWECIVITNTKKVSDKTDFFIFDGEWLLPFKIPKLFLYHPWESRKSSVLSLNSLWRILKSCFLFDSIWSAFLQIFDTSWAFSAHCLIQKIIIFYILQQCYI